MKICSIQDLKEIRQKAAAQLALRESCSNRKDEICCSLNIGTPRMQLLACGGTGCKASASHELTDNLVYAALLAGFSIKVDVLVTGCFGFW